MGILLRNNYFRKHDGLVQRTRLSLLLSTAYLLPLMGLWVICSLLISGLVLLVGPLVIPVMSQALTGLIYFYLLVGFARLILCRSVNQTHVGIFSQVISGFSPLIGGLIVGALLAGLYGGGLFLIVKFAPAPLMIVGCVILSLLMSILINCGLFYLADNETAGPLDAVVGTFSLLFQHLVKWLLWLAAYFLVIFVIVGVAAALLWLVDLVVVSHLGLMDQSTFLNITEMFRAMQAGDYYAVLGLSTVELLMLALILLLYIFVYIFGQMSFAVTYAQAVYYNPEALERRVTFIDFHH